MRAFFVGLVFLVAAGALCGIAVLLYPLLVVLAFFLRVVVSFLLVIFAVWLLGTFIIFVWEKMKSDDTREG